MDIVKQPIDALYFCSSQFSKETKVKSCLKGVVYVQGQGVDLVLKRSVHEVREHFKLNRNAALGRKMHF